MNFERMGLEQSLRAVHSTYFVATRDFRIRAAVAYG